MKDENARGVIRLHDKKNDDLTTLGVPVALKDHLTWRPKRGGPTDSGCS